MRPAANSAGELPHGSERTGRVAANTESDKLLAFRFERKRAGAAAIGAPVFVTFLTVEQ
jgi:hypothetical protein